MRKPTANQTKIIERLAAGDKPETIASSISQAMRGLPHVGSANKAELERWLSVTQDSLDLILVIEICNELGIPITPSQEAFVAAREHAITIRTTALARLSKLRDASFAVN